VWGENNLSKIKEGAKKGSKAEDGFTKAKGVATGTLLSGLVGGTFKRKRSSGRLGGRKGVKTPPSEGKKKKLKSV